MAGSSRRHRKRPPGRRPPHREPGRRVLVVCEGVVTEREYLRGFQRWCRNPLVDVEIAREHGVPRTVVEVAKRLKHAAERDARSQKDAFLAYDSVWCVIDVDEHPKLDEALDMARANGVEVALSNPCFELWLRLHFRESPGMRDRKAAQRMTGEFLPGYDKHLSFDALQGGYEDAVRRAERLDTLAAEAGEPGRNPTTGVYRLTEEIRRFRG